MVILRGKKQHRRKCVKWGKDHLKSRSFVGVLKLHGELFAKRKKTKLKDTRFKGPFKQNETKQKTKTRK